jgi:uncharacterized HAD superfamily protein
MRIGLDFDGVFCDSGKLLRDSAKEVFKVDIPLGMNFDYKVVSSGYLTSEQLSSLKEVVFESSKFGLEVLPGADLVCRQLLGRGHDLQILTKREKSLDIVRVFCENLGLRIPITGTPKGKPKSSVKMDFDVFVDDSISNLEDLKKYVPKLFLFSWDYNLSYKNHPGERVYDWEDFSKKIN